MSDVDVIAPDGEPGSIPAANLDAALASGFKLAGPAPAAPQAAAQPPASPPAGRMVDVVAPDGELGSIPEENLDAALDAGFARPSRANEAQYGGAGQRVLTAAEGVLRGQSVGLSDVALPYIEGVGTRIGEAFAGEQSPEGFAPPTMAGPERSYTQEAREAMAGREDTNPATAMTSNVAGALLTAAATQGGSGLLAGSGRLLPAALVARGAGGILGGAEAAGTVLARAGLKNSATLMKVLGLAAAGAAEGTAFAAGDAVSKMALRDDYHGIGERILLGTALGAGGSLAVGGALSAAGKLARKVFGKAGKEAAEEGAEAAATGAQKLDAVPVANDNAAALGDDAARVADDVLPAPVADELPEALTAADQAAIDEGLLDPQYLKSLGMKTDAEITGTLDLTASEPVRAFGKGLIAKLQAIRTKDELVTAFQDARDVLIKPFTRNLDQLSRIRQNILDPFINRGKKPDVLRRLVEEDGTQWTPERADEMIGFLDEIGEISRGFKDPKVSPNYRPEQQAAFTAVEGASEKARTYLTKLSKGEAGPVQQNPDAMADVIWAFDNLKGVMGARARPKNNFVTSPAEARLQDMYMQLRGMLQDPALVGQRVADMQRATNAAETKSIAGQRAFFNTFGKGEGTVMEAAGEYGFNVLRELDPRRIKSLFDNAGKPEAFKDEEIFLQGLERGQELLEVKSKWYRMSPEALEQVGKGRQLVEQLKDDFAKARFANMRADEATKFAQSSKTTNEAIAALGAILGGAPVVGGAFKALGSATSAISSPLGKLLSRGQKAPVVNLMLQHPAAAEAAQGAVKAQTAMSRAARLKGYLEPSAKTRAVAPVVSAGAALRLQQWLAGDETKSPLPTPEQIQTVAAEEPLLGQALEQNVAAQRAFFAEKLGPQPKDAMGRLIPYPTATLQRVARYAQSIQDPGGALERMGNGTGSAQDREVLEQLYPSVWQEFLLKASETLADSKTPRKARLRASHTLGVPFDPSLSPDSLSYAQSVAAKQRPSAAAALKMDVAPMDVATKSEQLSQ